MIYNDADFGVRTTAASLPGYTATYCLVDLFFYHLYIFLMSLSLHDRLVMKRLVSFLL